LARLLYASHMRVFVTVGATTPFDSLVEAVLSDNIRKILLDIGYNVLVIQVGPSERFRDLLEERDGLTVHIWQLKPSLRDVLEASDLVISHAGATRPFTSHEALSRSPCRFWFNIGCTATPQTTHCSSKPNSTA
jgi:Glycosyltransferase family 28 C-terminal domain